MIKTEDWQGTPVCTLENEKLHVSLCPSIGNNVYRIWDKVKQREVLRVPAGPQELAASPVHYGTPVLMPPNRIQQGFFRYRDREYRLEINTPTGHHIHGFIKAAPWKVAEMAEGAVQQAVTCTLETADLPEMMRQYPHDLLFEMTYVLEGASLTQKLKVTNRSQEAAPFGYGLHTWFTLDGKPEQWKLLLPAEGIWELNEDLLPTGRILPLGEHQAFSGGGGNLQGKDLDTVFRIGNHPGIATLSNIEGYDIRYSTSAQFKHWVIYTKGIADQWICLEPYTWVTNAPNLEMDPAITGLAAIEPQATLQLEVALDIIYHS